ncbi:hypothetical protein RUM43_012553 [Polyplax serrata]|uniref:Uncharacterized protein n=1 Tax=Polyplax serrata TaxID=468196 RepID=A0AAN8P3Z8_POLSC
MIKNKKRPVDPIRQQNGQWIRTPSDKAEAFANYLQEIFQPYLPENEAPPSSPVLDREMNHSSIILNLTGRSAGSCSLTGMPDIIVTEVESIFPWIASNTMWSAPADFLETHPAITKEGSSDATIKLTHWLSLQLCNNHLQNDKYPLFAKEHVNTLYNCNFAISLIKLNN